jgi:two-component system response regulator FixJ
MTAVPMIHIIEDDSGLRSALTLLLQGNGFDVRAYPSAEAFLSELDRLQPICLLTDLRLPAMDGLTLYRHLIKLGLEPAIVIITAYGDGPTAVAALKEGVVDFVEKPFDPVLLLESVREAWQRAAASQERRRGPLRSKRSDRG